MLTYYVIGALAGVGITLFVLNIIRLVTTRNTNQRLGGTGF